MSIPKFLSTLLFSGTAGMGLAIVQAFALPTAITIQNYARPNGTLLPTIVIAEANKLMDYVSAAKVLQTLCYNSLHRKPDGDGGIRIPTNGGGPGGWTPYIIKPLEADNTLDVIVTLSKLKINQAAACHNDGRTDAEIQIIQNIDKQSTPPDIVTTPELDAKLKEAADVVQRIDSDFKKNQGK